MKLAVFIIGGVQLALLAAAILKLTLAGIHSDAAGQGMGQAYALIGTLVALLLLGPVDI